MAHNVSMKQWEKSASELGNLEVKPQLLLLSPHSPELPMAFQKDEKP